MNKEEKVRLQKEYEKYSDEGLLEIAESDKNEFQEGVYGIILDEIKKRGLRGKFIEREKIKKQQEEAHEHEINLVTIKQFSYRHEAELAKGILEDQGIEVFMSADDCGGVRPELSFSIGVELLVKKEDLEKCREILKIIENNNTNL